MGDETTGYESGEVWAGKGFATMANDKWEAVTSTPAGHTYASTSLVVAGSGKIIATNLSRAAAAAIVDAHNG